MEEKRQIYGLLKFLISFIGILLICIFIFYCLYIQAKIEKKKTNVIQKPQLSYSRVIIDV